MRLYNLAGISIVNRKRMLAPPVENAILHIDYTSSHIQLEVRFCAHVHTSSWSCKSASMLKQKSLSLCTAKRRKEHPQTSHILSSLLPPGMYNRRIRLPPGISNGANLCYAISVVQCLFNHPTFRCLFEEMCAFHEEKQCETCLAHGTMLL